MRGLLRLSPLLLVGACSAADHTGSGDRRTANQPWAPVGTAGAGAAGSGASMDPPGFGNASMGMVAQQPPPPGAIGQCSEGFCGPKGADGDCGSFIVNTDVEMTVTPGNLLVVFDQSASMVEPWPATGTTKLEAAQRSLSTALMPLKDLLTVGAIFLPTTSCAPGRPGLPGGAVAPIDGQGQIPFMPGPQFLTAWDTHWQMSPPGLTIGTPLQEAFMRADEALTKSTLKGQTIVVAFTDGAPNCFMQSGGGLGIGGLGAGGPLAPPNTDVEVERAGQWLAMKGIKTYVVGLPGAQGVQVLNDIAVSGGTMNFIVPENTMDLEMKLRSAVEETVKRGLNSCKITLDPAPAAPEKLHLIVAEASDPTQSFQVDRKLSDDAGWTLSPDATTVELTGRLCEDALAGRFGKVTFEYGCVDKPPLPPPPPVL